MTRFAYAALGVAMMLGACTTSDRSLRLDGSNDFAAAFQSGEASTPAPIGTRAENDIFRFSTMGPQ